MNLAKLNVIWSWWCGGAWPEPGVDWALLYDGTLARLPPIWDWL